MDITMGDVRGAWAGVRRWLVKVLRAHFMLDHVDTDQDWIDRGW